VARSFSDQPDRFQRLKTAFLFGSGLDGMPVEIESAWNHGEKVILKFRGFDSITEAERLRGADVCIPRNERPELPEGEYYRSDLTGFEVIERESGASLGRVAGWQDCGGPPLLRVEPDGGGELLIPFAGSICVRIDLEGRRIVVDLPEGLRELNR
jgi:16S rRNA processing protein RimM